MATREVKPNDNIQNVLNQANPGDTILFKKGRYKSAPLKVNTKNLTLQGENATMIDTQIHLCASDVTVQEFDFVGNSVVDAKINKLNDEKTMGKNAVIRNNTFRDISGYAKRIKVAASSFHEHVPMNPLIENNQFLNIKGLNNRKKPGGELISIKASGAQIINNNFDKVAGMISLRGGENSIVDGNTRLSKNAVFWPNSAQFFGPGHITLECPRLLGFGLGHGGPKSGQGRWAVLDGLRQYDDQHDA